MRLNILSRKGARASGATPSSITYPSRTFFATCSSLISMIPQIHGPTGCSERYLISSFPTALTILLVSSPKARISPFPDKFMPREEDNLRPCARDRRRISVVPKVPAPRNTNSFAWTHMSWVYSASLNFPRLSPCQAKNTVHSLPPLLHCLIYLTSQSQNLFVVSKEVL